MIAVAGVAAYAGLSGRDAADGERGARASGERVGLPAPPDTLTARITRFAPGTGEVLVSNGVPLRPGRLFPDEAEQVRVLVDEKEQPVHSEALHGLHADGSLRTVLVQFLYRARPGVDTDAIIVLGAPREVVEPPALPQDRSVPEAVVLPDDPRYLSSTGLAGPMVPRSRSVRWGDIYRKYEENFDRFAETLWRKNGARWEENYYDRALIYYAFWLRTANPEYFRRGTALAVNYREDYLEPNDYGSSPHWSQLEGLALHYLLTGDEASRTAVGGVATTMTIYHPKLADTVNTAWMENRIQARVLQSYLLAWQLDAPGDDWAERLDDGLTRVLRTQRADGSYGFPGTCHGSLNYMAGLLNDVFIKIYTDYRPDSRIPVAVKGSLDYLWTQWIPSASAFTYLSEPCTVGTTNVGSSKPAPDLNSLIVTGFAWYGQLSGDATYRHRAELIFAGGVNGAYLAGSKQFNEAYTMSWRHLSYRFPADTDSTTGR